MRLDKPWLPLLLLSPLLGLVACDEPGVCEQKVRRNSIRYGQCVEVEHGGQCPFPESGNDEGEYAWEFHPGEACEDYGYEFDCGGGIWEDVESECAEAQTTE